MITQNLYNPTAEAPTFLATILDEIVGSQGSQVAIDELGLSIATHVGFKRTRNEDRIAVARMVAPNRETYTVALICDGVGGSESGDRAAALATASVIADLAQQQDFLPIKELAATLVKRADDLVRKELHGRGATTLVMLLATAGGYFVCANVGDSRAYSWDPSSNKLKQVTVDDTIENELKDLPGHGAALIKARGLEGRLSQAIGEGGRISDELRIQLYTKEHFPVGAVLGSDGLWRAARDFEAIVANANTPADAVRRAITHANLVGGVDNSSMIAICNVETLCRGRKHDHDSIVPKLPEIELWLSSNKVKIVTSNRIPEVKSALPRPKQDRAKVKSKRKDHVNLENAAQLELETVDSTRARPKIEVTVDEGPKKS
jgi:serine/threonine protein phosphatase PrpC